MSIFGRTVGKCVRSKEFLDTQANIECRFTLSPLRDMIRTYSQMHLPDKYSQHSSIWSVWLNGWVFAYELSDCGFESCCCYRNILITSAIICKLILITSVLIMRHAINENFFSTFLKRTRLWKRLPTTVTGKQIVNKSSFIFSWEWCRVKTTWKL